MTLPLLKDQIMRLPLNIKYNIFCGVMLAANTLYVNVVQYKWKLLFAKRFTITYLPL